MMMKIALVLALVAYASGEVFKVTGPDNKTCVLLTLKGTLDLAAYKGTTELDTKNIDFATAKVLNESDCTTIKLDLGNSAQVWFQVGGTDPNKDITPISTFDPNTVFDGKVNETDSPVFKAAAVGPFGKDQSFSCIASIKHTFEGNGTVPEYSYTVTANTTNLEVQFGGISNDSFSEGPHCKEDATTTPIPSTTPSVPSTTPAPTAPVVDYNVTENNVTCIKMEGAFKMVISYETAKENKTYTTVVPKSATSQGVCGGSKANASSISITFDGGLGDDWTLKYDFAISADRTSYYISQVDITYSNLPGAKTPGPMTATYNATDSNYLKGTSAGYYLCTADQTATVEKVQLTSSNFKYRAFNEKTGPLNFDGDVSECAADEETSSVVPIAVGAALAGLVVIVLVAYLIGRRRSRKSGYESV